MYSTRNLILCCAQRQAPPKSRPQTGQSTNFQRFPCGATVASHLWASSARRPPPADFSHRTEVREVLCCRFKQVVIPSYGTSTTGRHGWLPWTILYPLGFSAREPSVYGITLRVQAPQRSRGRSSYCRTLRLLGARTNLFLRSRLSPPGRESTTPIAMGSGRNSQMPMHCGKYLPAFFCW